MGEANKALEDINSNQRLGLRCPSSIYTGVKANAVASADKRRAAVDTRDRKDISDARQTLLRLFPRISLDSAEKVLQHGFAKRSGRVGRSTTLDGDEKVTLAVAAHARHKMTPYDSLLQELEQTYGRGDTARRIARERIQPKLDEVLASWRKQVVTLQKAKAVTSTATQQPLKKDQEMTIRTVKIMTKSTPMVEGSIRSKVSRINKPRAKIPTSRTKRSARRPPTKGKARTRSGPRKSHNPQQ